MRRRRPRAEYPAGHVPNDSRVSRSAGASVFSLERDHQPVDQSGTLVENQPSGLDSPFPAPGVARNDGISREDLEQLDRVVWRLLGICVRDCVTPSKRSDRHTFEHKLGIVGESRQHFSEVAATHRLIEGQDMRFQEASGNILFSRHAAKITGR